MSSKLQSPVVVGLLGVGVSVGLGVALIFRAFANFQPPAAEPALAEVKEELVRKGWDFWTIEIDNLSTELKEERLKLRKQAELLDQRAARLSAEEKEFAKLRADIESMRKQIGEKILEIGADEAKNLRTLSTTYATLSPKAAVAIIKEMDDSTVVKILSLMKPDVVGPIFEEMGRIGAGDPALAKRAAAFSEKLRMMKAAKSGS